MNDLYHLETEPDTEKDDTYLIDFDLINGDGYFEESSQSDQNSSKNDSNPSSSLNSFSFDLSNEDEEKLNSSLFDFYPNFNNEQKENHDQQSIDKAITQNDDIVDLTKYEIVTKKSQQKVRQKTPRKHYHQPPESIKFMDEYNKLFNDDGTEVRKPLIKKYHIIAHKHNSLIQKWCRRAERVKVVYFNIYAHQDQLILQTLKKLIDAGVINYDEDENAFASHKKKVKRVKKNIFLSNNQQ